MGHQHEKPMGASLPTILVYEEAEGFAQYAGAGKLPVCIYDRERSVLEAARRVASSRGLDSIRVVFIVRSEPASGLGTHPERP